jgi:asparagine synthase (glutamine-hydrolysing)
MTCTPASWLGTPDIMCGLAGLFSPAADAPRSFDGALLARMTDAIAHRGPDGEGFHLEPHVALGHRRLAVIDLHGGAQPMANEDGSVLVVFNGEIYNHRELAAELVAAGHHLRTRSDTEVIVHAWEQWGEACVRRLRGMFAFALWDRRQRTLFLARDRLGVKPLFWSRLADGSIAFGSELKALTLLPGFDHRLCDYAIEEYFAFGYVPDPRTIYRDTFKLEPAHTLSWRVGEREPRIAPYWDLSFEPDGSITRADAAVQLRERLTEAVRIRMVSEVPLGAFLSGGVDSSAVVATMAGLSAEPVRTCSIAFADAAYDESRYAARVAAQYRTDHVVETVDGDQQELIGRLAGLFDEPFADSSALPTWRVCRLARQRVTVALSGDGGDEAFGGYRRYRLHLMEERLRGLFPGGLRRALFGPLGNAWPKLDFLPRPLRAKTTLQALARSSLEAYFHSVSVLRDEERRALYSPEFRRRLGGYSAFEVFRRHAARAPTDQPLALLQYLDCKTYLPGDINTKVDRASMAHSLEVREPLMDHELIEWAARLPQSLKATPAQGKIVLKDACAPLLPHDLLHRPKMGFAVPLANWFRQGLSTGVTRDGSALRDTVAGGAERQWREEHRSGRRDRSAALWLLGSFARFEGRPP